MLWLATIVLVFLIRENKNEAVAVEPQVAATADGQ
jgi:hypothetical protein